jgi:hypothetical protein
MTVTFDLGMVDINDLIVIDGQLYKRYYIDIRFVEREKQTNNNNKKAPPQKKKTKKTKTCKHTE